jgi:hypothetical protein
LAEHPDLVGEIAGFYLSLFNVLRP